MKKTFPLSTQRKRTPAAKLTEEAVRDILASPESSRAAAKRYGVTGSNVWAIRRGLTWRHLGAAPQDRSAIGEAHPNAKLTEADVREIRSSSSDDHLWLARRYGVTPSHINNIRARRVWRHVTAAAG
jgi:hypothetical protein